MPPRNPATHRRPPAQALPPASPPLTASDLHVEVPGHTFYQDRASIFPGVYGRRLTMYVSADGLLFGTLIGRPDGGPEHDVGRWHSTPQGQFCRTWQVWDHRRERCYTLQRSCPVLSQDGESFAFSVTDRWGTALYRRVPGNAEGY